MTTRKELETRLEITTELRQDTERELIRLQAQEDLLRVLIDTMDGKRPVGLMERYMRLGDPKTA